MEDDTSKVTLIISVTECYHLNLKSFFCKANHSSLRRRDLGLMESILRPSRRVITTLEPVQLCIKTQKKGTTLLPLY